MSSNFPTELFCVIIGSTWSALIERHLYSREVNTPLVTSFTVATVSVLILSSTITALKLWHRLGGSVSASMRHSWHQSTDDANVRGRIRRRWGGSATVPRASSTAQLRGSQNVRPKHNTDTIQALAMRNRKARLSELEPQA